MKAKFKKDFSHRAIWLPIVLFSVFLLSVLICVVLTPLRFEFCSGLLGCSPFIIVVCLKPYELTDLNVLQGNGTIQVDHIYRIQEINKGISVFYTWPGGKAERKRFFAVKDIDAFISTLQEINPNIKLN
ncbi:hypothetical protein [Parabacteroides faecis]|uniref:hypothetical protein n=1 Tax=Parabacteroides faecis TaxID=1217282 RepID=UPI0035221721